MISVDMYTDDIDKLIRGLPRETRELQGETIERVKDTARAIVREEIYRTGALYAGIVSDYTDPDAPMVLSTAPHSMAVYFGSVRNNMVARPFLQWAVDMISPYWLSEVNHLVEKALGHS